MANLRPPVATVELTADEAKLVIDALNTVPVKGLETMQRAMLVVGKIDAAFHVQVDPPVPPAPSPAKT